MKMAVVGCEASGKTVFMCALADYFGRDGANNPLRLKLTPENAAANSFERFQFRQMRCFHQWPPATPPDRTIEIKWSLRHEGRTVSKVDMLEFGGETFRAAFRDGSNSEKHETAVAELLKYLSDADFFVVLVSIKALLANPNVVTQEDFDLETEALWVTRGILEFIRKRRPHAGIVIGLTQADKYRNELGEAGGPRQFFAAHWPTVASAASDIPIVEVASVSKTDAAGNPAEGYRTHGILPVMQEFASHCFGDPNALENGKDAQLLPSRATLPVWLTQKKIFLGALVTAGILAAALLTAFWPKQSVDDSLEAFAEAGAFSEAPSPEIIEHVVTNTVETVVEKPVTNTIEKLVEVVVTNNIETLVEKPVTNTIETVVEVERIIEVPVTNTVEKVVQVEKFVKVKVPVTNTVEKVVEVEKVLRVEVPITNTVEKLVEVEVPITNTVEKVVEVEKLVRVEVPITNTVEKLVEVEVPITNTVEKVVEVEKLVRVEIPITNIVEKQIEVEVPITNTIEKIVEVPVTNYVEKVVEVEKLIERPITNTIETVVEVEKLVEIPVTNTVEKLIEVEKVVTNTIEKVVAAPIAKSAPSTPQPQPSDLPPGYRVWTDYNGRKIIAKWVGTAVDKSGITIITRYNRRIDAVLWKFSPEDQAYIKAELKLHEDRNEVMSDDGTWIKNPLMRK